MSQNFVKGGEVCDDMLSGDEMVFRPYDLCLACATQTVMAGKILLEMDFFDSNGK